MVMPLIFLAGFFTVIVTPGLIAQYLEERKATMAQPELKES